MSGDLRFDAVTRSTIERGYLRRLPGGGDPHDPRVADRIQYLIGMLEHAAELREDFQPFEDREHQERKRSAAKLRTAAGKLLDAMEGLDLDALAYLERCIAVQEIGQVEADKVAPVEYFESAVQEREKSLEQLARFHAAATQLAKELPKLDKVSAAASVACAVGNAFHDLGMEFPVSDTGFAAECMASTLALAGLGDSSIRYWIQRGREHPMSRWNFGDTSAWASPKK